ncbi:MAG: hypothetical protein AB8B74_12060 [Crocinitomicaceae bacterium]
MRHKIIFGIAIIGLVVLQSIQAQQSCRKVHEFCKDGIPDDEQTKAWEMDNQSKYATVEKGKVYEMSFISYRDFVYRISTCTDVADAEKISFEIFHTELVRRPDVNGNPRIFKEKVSIYNNKADDMTQFYKFRVEKSEKLYVRVNIPISGKSEAKQFKDSDFVCVGVLLEHSKAERLGF